LFEPLDNKVYNILMPNLDSVTLLKEQVLQKRPVLRDIFQANAGKSVRSYTDSVIQNGRQINNQRKEEFITALRAEVGLYFPPAVADSVALQMQDNYCLSTAEHHGPLTHPFFVHSNLLTIGQGLDNTVILAVGNVSLNNQSYPRGLILHSAGGQRHRLPFFSSKTRLSPLFGHRPFEKRDLDQLRQRLLGGNLSKELQVKVLELIDRVYDVPEVLGQATFSSQVTVSNGRLWQNFFSATAQKTPRLIMLQLEGLILRLLKQHHLFFCTEISELLFNTKIRSAIIEHFDGIPGNFSIKEKKGTFLFWALPVGRRRRQQLWPEGDYLSSDDGYSVRLSPEAISQAIERGELVPNMFLGSLLLSKYYGVKCLGGFSQGTYLTAIHRAYNQMRGSINKFEDHHTKGLRSDFVLGYFKNSFGSFSAASGIDLALHNTPQSWEAFSRAANILTLEEAMMPLFPELYRELYHQQDQDPELLKLGANDIVNFYHIADKISACINILS